MAPQPQGAPRWDAQTQRWVWDGPGPGPAAGPPAGLPSAPPSPSPAPPSAQPGYGPVPPPPPPYDPHRLPGPPRPGGTGGGSRWLTPVTAGVAVAALVISGAAVWFVQRDSGGIPRKGGRRGRVPR